MSNTVSNATAANAALNEGEASTKDGVTPPLQNPDWDPDNKLQAFVMSERFQWFVRIVIIINAITLGLETSKDAMAAFGSILLTIDKICIAIFVFELLLKLAAFRWRFFMNGWNIFDSLIVGVALVPSGEGLSVLRALRVLRIFRVVTASARMRGVVEALFRAIPAMGSVIAILGLVFYIFAVMATKLFGSSFPQWFGTLGESLYSLFQIMTLESWSMGIVRPVMEVYPYAWLVFVPFIVVTTFAVVNLFVAIIVNSMSKVTDEEMAELHHQDELIEALTVEVRALRDEVHALRDEKSQSS